MQKVALLKARSYERGLKERVGELLALLEEPGTTLKRGQKVLLKPNFLLARPPETAAITHPKFVVAVTELLLDYGCRVTVGESPGIGRATDIARKIGLSQQLESYGVKVMNFQKPVPVADGFISFAGRQFPRQFRRLQLAGELDDFDQVVNLPKLKSHGQMGLTLATKNLFGCVVGSEKGQWHFAAGKDLQTFARLLVEIALSTRAGLHILDGIVGMDGNGPSNGRARAFDVIAAGKNPVAVDRVILELVGKRTGQVPIFPAARKLGIPGTDLKEIEVVGDNLQDCRIPDFQMPSVVDVGMLGNRFISGLLRRMLKQRLILDETLCIGCRKCEAHCPARAIVWTDKISIDESKCIKCCCCQEMCPVGALSVSDPLPAKIVRRLGWG